MLNNKSAKVEKKSGSKKKETVDLINRCLDKVEDIIKKSEDTVDKMTKKQVRLAIVKK
mgnify:CR=1 FL=1